MALTGGWVRNTVNKALLRSAGAGTLPELGNSIGNPNPFLPVILAYNQACD